MAGVIATASQMVTPCPMVTLEHMVAHMIVSQVVHTFASSCMSSLNVNIAPLSIVYSQGVHGASSHLISEELGRRCSCLHTRRAFCSLRASLDCSLQGIRGRPTHNATRPTAVWRTGLVSMSSIRSVCPGTGTCFAAYAVAAHAYAREASGSNTCAHLQTLLQRLAYMRIHAHVCSCAHTCT